MRAFFLFFHLSVTKGRAYSQAFLAETVETGNTNRNDYYCMQKHRFFDVCFRTSIFALILNGPNLFRFLLKVPPPSKFIA